MCVIETADLSWNRGRGEEQPADAAGSLVLPTVAWRPGGDQRSLLVTGCGAGDGVVRRGRVEVGCCLVSPCVCLTGPGVAEKDRRRAINEGRD